MCDDVKNCCRICLDEESVRVSIIGDPTISLHVKSCLSVTVSSNDQLPKTICVSCVSQLSQFYNFQLNARCSQDWLESALQEKMKKSNETKMLLQPLPDSEYNSDSLLEFLNNTANIEEYLNNLGKEDIPSIVNMLDKNEHSIEISKFNFKGNLPSPIKKDVKTKTKLKMEIDILDSDIKIVKEILMKETDKTKFINKGEKIIHSCFACKHKFDSLQKLLQHMSICDYASRSCIKCNTLFDSKLQMQHHSIMHNTSLPFTCNCGEQFQTKDKLVQHHKICHTDYGASIGCVYRCKKCGDIFKERIQLYKHAKQHVLKSEERVCDICGHTFIGNDALIKHRKEEHKKPENVLYRCKVCNQTFADHTEIYKHVQNHMAKRPEPIRHLCESCGRSFATLATLARHSLQHESKGFKCSVCSKRFPDEKGRDDHISEHIENVMCEKCGQNVNNNTLEAHSCV